MKRALWMMVMSVICWTYMGGQSVAQEAVTKEQLLETTSAWDGKAYTSYPAGQPQLTVLKITIPAHSVLDWHHHPMPNAAYVMSGTLTVESKDGTKKTFQTGQALAETVDEVHRGAAGDEPVVLIVFYAGHAGTPLSVPEPK
jgi:quercetin dioxygenase-like cupin family protein